MEMKTTDIAAALTAAPEWVLPRVKPVPMARWGKDHWTTLLYAKTRWVDHAGVLDPEHLRCDRTRHPFFYLAKYRTTLFGTDADGAKYPTRLKTETPGEGGVWGTVELPGHDDLDCLNDAITEGLVEVRMPAVRGGFYVDARGRNVCIGGSRRSGSTIGGEPIPAGSLITGMVEGWLMTSASFALTPRGQEIVKQLEAFVAVTRRSHQFVPDVCLTCGGPLTGPWRAWRRSSRRCPSCARMNTARTVPGRAGRTGPAAPSTRAGAGGVPRSGT